MSTKLCAAYELDNSNLLAPTQNLHLVIARRAKPTPQKPLFYLLQRLSPKEHIYISSLFEWQELASNELTEAKKWYSFDWQGIAYVLFIDYATNTAEISLLDALADTPNQIMKGFNVGRG